MGRKVVKKRISEDEQLIQAPAGSDTQAGDAAMMSLSDQIAVALASEISRGDYKPGDRIHEQAVSVRFGVSRGPIREALRILDKQGLVAIQPRRGARVTNPSVDEVNHIFEIRSVLLGLAARTVAELGSAETLDGLRERVRSLREANSGDKNPDDYLQEVHQLTIYMSESSGNVRLTSIMRSLFHQTLRYSRLGLSTEARRKRSITNWRKIVDCIAERDGAGAEEHARALVTASRDMAVKLLTAENMAH